MSHLEKLLRHLVSIGGSDLHLSVGNPAMARVRGRLQPATTNPLNEKAVRALIEEVTGEEKAASVGDELDLDLAYESPAVGRFRVNILHSRTGPGAVFRVIPTDIPSPDEIRMPHSVRRLAQKEKGLVLVTGPTGSGKSTTLACLVNLINENRASHIVTIEDPIEFVHQSKRSLITQREVGQHTKSFARALRAALREDPDVILVGEMRDIETMALAVTAAETGHLVLATLHTMSASKTLDRIIDSFPSEQQAQIRVQLAGSLEAIVAQQLLPSINGTGRVAAFEVLLMNSAVHNIIREGKTHQLPNTIQMNRAMGMQKMDDALLDLAKNRLVNPDDAIKHADAPDVVERDLNKFLSAVQARQER